MLTGVDSITRRVGFVSVFFGNLLAHLEDRECKFAAILARRLVFSMNGRAYCVAIGVAYGHADRLMMCHISRSRESSYPHLSLSIFTLELSTCVEKSTRES